MLIYKLYKFESDLILYQYYSQLNDAGLISVNRKTGEITVIRQSDDDIGGRMANKLAMRLKDFYAENAYKEAGTIAWY